MGQRLNRSIWASVCLAAMALTAQPALAQFGPQGVPQMRGDGPPPQAQPFRIERVDPALDQLIASDAQLVEVASGFGLNEGVTWVPEGDSGYVLVSGLLDNVVYKVTMDGTVTAFIEQAGYSGDDPSTTGFQTRSGRSHVLLIGPLSVVGLIALVLAIVNYVNLSTARADLRAREVALRKVMGAPRGALIRQFLGESLAAACIAGLLGLALAELTLPLVNAAGGTDLTLVYLGWNGILWPLAAVVLVTGLAAGLYPAFVLSRFQPASVLNSAQSPGLGRRGKTLRSALVVGQFAVAIALMIGTGVLLMQARHLQRSDLGFARDGLVMVPSFANPNLDPAQREAMRREIAALPAVTGTTLSAAIPTGGSFSIRNFERQETQTTVELLEGLVGPEFFAVYGARLLAGRPFEPGRFPADLMPSEAQPQLGTHASRSFNAVFNRSAIRALGFASPEAAVGQTLAVGDAITIIGVMDDLRFGDPREAVQPQAYYLATDHSYSPALTIRHTGDAQPVIAAIERIWQDRAGIVPFDATSVNRALYERYYEADLQRSRLFALGAALAVVIGCLGLYGLAAFDTSRRVREIGIRKALGASTRDIIRLLVAQFLRPVLIANVIAWPLAFFAMRRWLAGFDDKVALSPAFFVGASVLAVLIAACTVFAQAWRVARAAPATALRNE